MDRKRRSATHFPCAEIAFDGPAACYVLSTRDALFKARLGG